MYGFIYITTNHVNGKKYIGQKKYVKGWEEYLGSGIHLKRAIKKYGASNFSREIIEECDSKEQLDIREIYWIDYYDAVNSKNYYNIANGGNGGNTTAGYSVEEKEAHLKKSSLSKKGIINQGKYNPNAKRVICLNNMKIFDTCVDAAKYGKTSDNAIQRCCLYKDKYKTAGEDPITNERLQWDYYYDDKEYVFVPYKRNYDSLHNTNKKKIICIETNEIFLSIKDAAISIGVKPSTISTHLSGKTKCVGTQKNGKGYHFKFA